MEIINDSQWLSGVDSINYNLGQGMYQWAQNVVNRGGILQTRQGLAEVAAIAGEDPRGIGVAEVNGITWMLACIGDGIYGLNLNNPAAGLVRLRYPNNSPVVFASNKRMVHFELCVQAQESIHDPGPPPGYINRNITTPKFVMIIQDGINPPHYWDGDTINTVDSLYPDTVNHNTPKASFMKWAGDRLWVCQGRKVRASNLLNPFQFTDETILASGGFFYLPDRATGMGVTHDFKSLLVFTNFTTSAFQVGIEDRPSWGQTQDFQRVIFPSIGCVAHRTIINMYGLTWWMSHDGWVGLDNALNSAQSSKLDIQDQNMSRSKAGINWSQGGGAAGAFGNFLFVSVPSHNKWNQHTWVMDQAPIDVVSGSAPPAWASNWTGIRPEQWVTTTINNQQRCFCISRDLVTTGHQSTVWEAFIGQRMDVPDVNGEPKAKDIGCAVETRFIGLAPNQYCTLRWIEIDCCEIIGNVDLKVYYCGRRTSYKQIINTRLTATVSASTEEVFEDDGVKIFVPQYRTIRSVTDAHSEDDNDPEIQTPYLRNKDREFSVIVEWIGQMGISAVRLAVDPETDYMEGVDYTPEYLARRITAEGDGTIACKLPPPNAPTNAVTSKFQATLKPRWVEFPAYDSAVPNGVFFVAELTAHPPPGTYPSSSFPIEVSLTSETENIDIYYTRDNTHPHGPPDQHGTHYPPKPSISINQHLRARGERDHMQPSVELEGQYTQAKCEDVVFTPDPGGYPPEQFDIPDPGPVPRVAYNFNQGTGDSLTDFSGNGIDGAIIGAAWNNNGKHGKCLSFNGTSDRVNCTIPQNIQHLQLTGSATWMAWVKATGDPASGVGTIVSKANNIRGWSLRTTNVSGQQRFAIQYSPADHVFVSRQSTTVRALNTWYHVCGVFDASAASLNIYVNGDLVNGTLTGTVTHAQLNAAPDCIIGRQGDGTNYFQGLIDDLRIYGEVLNEDQVTHDMNHAVNWPDPVASPLAVSLSCPTAGATIHWWIDDNGHHVTESDPVFDPANPIHPYSGNVILAKAFKQYYLPSDQVRGRYFSLPRVATPTFDPVSGQYPPGDYNPTKTITIATATPGSTLRYTINDPDVEHGTLINASHGTVEVHHNDTLRAMAFKANLSDSLIKTGSYTASMLTVANPTLHPADTTVVGNVHSLLVHIHCDTPNVSMRYVIVNLGDNTQPTRTNGTLIQGTDATVTVSYIGHKILRVIAFREDMVDSGVTVANYDWEPGGGH